MENQVQYYNETARYRDKFDEGLPVTMAHYSAFRKESYKGGALSQKVKRLIALAVGLQAGCPRCIIGQTNDAVAVGATKAEVLEAVSVAIVMGGTAGFINPRALLDVLEGIEQFMVKEGIKDITELIGAARR